MKVKLYTRNHKGKETLYVEYKEGEKRVRKSLHLEDTRKNVSYVYRNIIPQIELKLERNLRPSGYKLSKFTEMVLDETKEEKKISTFKTYEVAINKFFKIMGDVDLETTRIRDIDMYVRTLKKEGLSSATISLYIVPIKMAFKEAIRLEIIDKNPVTFVKKPKVKNKEKKPFSLLQMHNLLNKAEGELKLFLFFAFFTGARPNEILALKWKDISENSILIERTIVQKTIENTPKNGKSRRIALMKPLKEFLNDKERGNLDSRIIGVAYASINRSFKLLLEKVGYEKTTPHVTRHTFTSLLLQAKENPTLVQYFLGHSSLDMINKVYSHYIEDEQDVSRIEKILGM